ALAGRKNPFHDHPVHLVLTLENISVLVLHTQDEHWQRAFLFEGLIRHCDRKHSCDIALTIGSLISMALEVPTEDARLIVIEGHTISRWCEQNKIVGHIFVGTIGAWVNDVSQHKERDNALSLGVLRDLERDIDIQISPEDPTRMLAVAHQPPVFHWNSRRLHEFLFPWRALDR